MLYSKNINENLQQRVKLLFKAKNDTKTQQIIMQQCSNDVLFFFNMLLFTYKPKAV